MNNQQRFLLGMLAGASAVLTGSRLARSRHSIEFDGRVVVITGGSRGLGLVLARQLAAQGAKLCLLARDESELARARSHVIACGAAEEDVLTVRCDVRRQEDVRGAIERLRERWHAIDILINNAGVIQIGPLEHMKAEDFEDTMATHFWAALYMIQECLPSMKRRGFGRIVNISSIGGRIGVPHLAPYCASKFALAGLSDAIRAELLRYGVRVTTVSPGLMRTGSPRNAQVKGQHQAEYAWFAIADSIPGITTSAERAAAEILDACRFGDPELTITLAARLAVIANAVAPSAFGAAMALATNVLPGPTDASGDQVKMGHESESKWAPSVATKLTDWAAARNNEA